MEDLNSYIEYYIEKAKAKGWFYVPETPASVVSQLYLRLSLTPGVFISPIPPSLFKMITSRSIFDPGSTSRKSFDFFDSVVVTMMECLDWEIHLMEVAYLRLNFFRRLVELLAKLFSWVTEIDTVVDRDHTVIEASRDPQPKIFIPTQRLNRMAVLVAIHLSVRLFFSEQFHSVLKIFNLQTPKNRCLTIGTDNSGLWFNPHSNSLGASQMTYDLFYRYSWAILPLHFFYG